MNIDTERYEVQNAPIPEGIRHYTFLIDKTQVTIRDSYTGAKIRALELAKQAKAKSIKLTLINYKLK